MLFMCRGALTCAKDDEMTDRKTIKKQTERQTTKIKIIN